MINDTATVICLTTELGDPGAKSFVIPYREQSVEGILLHWQSQWLGYRNECPHTGINLNWLPDQFFDLRQQYLQCGMHGALFEPVNGYCVWGPCRGMSLIALPIRVEGQHVYLETASLDVK